MLAAQGGDRNREEAAGALQQDKGKGMSLRASGNLRCQESHWSMANEMWLEARRERAEFQPIERKTVLREKSSTSGWSVSLSSQGWKLPGGEAPLSPEVG